jgi:palmitoyltransferase
MNVSNFLKATSMNVVPVVCILLQSLLELFIYLWDVSPLSSLSSPFLTHITRAWLFTYFYTFAFYCAASFSNPGYLSPSWKREAQSTLNYHEELDDNGEKCYCEICKSSRPLRTHHCSVCRRCVLLMDHHCDFIGNCVGFRNYKNYLVFLISFSVHAFLTIFLIVRPFFSGNCSTFQILLGLLGLLYFGGIGAYVVLQLFAQLKFTFVNSTWIEESGRKIRDRLYRKYKAEAVNRFDLGWWANLRQRLGENPARWLVPAPMDGNPYVFPKNPKWVPVWHLHFQSMVGCQDDSDDFRPATRLRPIASADAAVL